LKIRCGKISHPILTCCYTNEFEIAIKEVFINSSYKPILRPLSDLTKEIEVNGERFVPIVELSYYANEQTNKGKVGLEWGIVNTFPYLDIQKLLSWHFDIYNLIEQGLAIDINTLND
jgi:hypothetical protein